MRSNASMPQRAGALPLLLPRSQVRSHYIAIETCLESLNGKTTRYAVGAADELTRSITLSGGGALAASYAGRGQAERTGLGGESYLNDLLGVGRRASAGPTPT